MKVMTFGLKLRSHSFVLVFSAVEENTFNF